MRSMGCRTQKGCQQTIQWSQTCARRPICILLTGDLLWSGGLPVLRETDPEEDVEKIHGQFDGCLIARWNGCCVLHHFKSVYEDPIKWGWDGWYLIWTSQQWIFRWVSSEKIINKYLCFAEGLRMGKRCNVNWENDKQDNVILSGLKMGRSKPVRYLHRKLHNS